MKKYRAVVVGLGGIGSWLVQGLCPFLNYQRKEQWEVVLVDGDEYEVQNHTRQVFTELGAKAEVQASWVARSFPNLTVKPVASYLSAKGEKGSLPIDQVIQTGDLVFSCVDNHKTRKIIAKHCQTLDDVALISGGNEYTDGNVQVFVRRDKVDLTATLDKYHPEIAKPKDKAPFELSCEEAAVSHPQLIFSNMTAAVLMLNAFYNIQDMNMEESEVYFDILANKVVPRVRKK